MVDAVVEGVSKVAETTTAVTAVAETAPAVVDAAASNLAEQATTTAVDSATAAEASTSIQDLIDQFDANPTDELQDKLAEAENDKTLHWEDGKPVVNDSATENTTEPETTTPNTKNEADEVDIDPEQIVTEHESADRSERVQKSVEINMEKWEQVNPAPDRESDPKGYEDWRTEKYNQKNEFEADANFLEDVKTWDDANPEPDISTSPDDHKKWEDDREAEKLRLKNKQMAGEKVTDTTTEESAEADEKNEEEKNKEGEKLSEKEIIEKTKLLVEKRKQKFNLEEGVKAIDNLAGEITNQHKIDRATFTSHIIVLGQEIELLEYELKSHAKTASPMVQMLINAALLTAVIAPTITQTANPSKK